MSELLKVEITIINGEWQWMGKLSQKSLKLLTQIADVMSDNDMLAPNQPTKANKE